MDTLSSNALPDLVQAKAQKDLSLGVYVHVPFCASTCGFCAFYQETPHRSDLLNFLETIRQEFNKTAPVRRVDTAFWGGGTPGVLPAKDLEKLGKFQIDALGAPTTEWTIELAPSTVKPDKLAALRDLGINRISLGVQSFDDQMIERLERRQSAKMALDAYDMVRDAGFENVNIDLMFALPGQTEAQWLQDLEKVRHLAPEHISTYCLTFEEDTALYTKLSQGKIIRDTEQEAAFYEMTWETLGGMGLHQYEISNFARPGQECLHNLNTWRMQEWIGFGPSASSQYQNRRYSNDANLETWTRGIENNQPAFMDCSTLTQEEQAIDSLIFGLRMNQGVDLTELHNRFGLNLCIPPLESQLDLWVQEGLATQINTTYALTLQGRLLADQIASELLALNER